MKHVYSHSFVFLITFSISTHLFPINFIMAGPSFRWVKYPLFISYISYWVWACSQLVSCSVVLKTAVFQFSLMPFVCCSLSLFLPLLKDTAVRQDLRLLLLPGLAADCQYLNEHFPHLQSSDRTCVFTWWKSHVEESPHVAPDVSKRQAASWIVCQVQGSTLMTNATNMLMPRIELKFREHEVRSLVQDVPHTSSVHP